MLYDDKCASIYPYLLDLAKKIRKPETVSVGKTSKKFGISGWDKWWGEPYPLRNKVIRRVYDRPEDCITEEEEKELKGVLAALSVESKSAAQTESGRLRRKENKAKLVARRDELLEKREPLTIWEMREVSRCLFGYAGMVGKHYLYFNYGWIEEIKDGGKRPIMPWYRACDDYILRLFHKVEDEHTGLTGGKRRQFGFSWISCLDDVYDMTFKDGTTFFVSKDEEDAKKYFIRFNHMYNSLPEFFQKPRIENAEDTKSFGVNYIIKAVRERFGIIEPDAPLSNARIRTGSPRNPKALAGDTLSKVKIDEIGEIEHLIEDWGIIEPAMRASNSRSRAGCFIGLGTVGRMERSGKVFKRFYKSAHVFKLQRVMIPGWMGMEIDEYGNEDRDAVVEDIKNTISELEAAGMMELAMEERQKYPLEEEDMWVDVGRMRLWPSLQIGMARDRIEEKGIGYGITYGLFYRDSNNEVKFKAQEPNASRDAVRFPEHIGYNQVQIWEHPEPTHFEHKYIAGCDPIDMNKSYDRKEGVRGWVHSDISFMVMKRITEVGGYDMMPVAMYAGRPDDPADAFEQMAMACEYYDCEVNIERNKGNACYNWFVQHDKIKYVATGVEALTKEKEKVAWGFNASEPWWVEMIQRGKVYWKKYYDRQWFMRFVDESMVVREENTDVVVAFLAALQYAEEINLREEVKGSKYEKTEKVNRPSFYIKDRSQKVLPKSVTFDGLRKTKPSIYERIANKRAAKRQL